MKSGNKGLTIPMPNDPLLKDPEPLAKWRLPQELPSRRVFPPAAGGSPRWLSGLLIVMAILIILALLSQARSA
jgi:hypothetical protein